MKTKSEKQMTPLFPITKKQPKAVRNADYLSLLSRTNNKRKRQQLIDIANKDQIDAISEVIENILRGTLVLTQVQHNRLRRYKKCMRQLVARRTSLRQKKDYLQTYSGGFIPFLLRLVAPLLGTIVSKFIK